MTGGEKATGIVPWPIALPSAKAGRLPTTFTKAAVFAWCHTMQEEEGNVVGLVLPGHEPILMDLVAIRPVPVLRYGSTPGYQDEDWSILAVLEAFEPPAPQSHLGIYLDEGQRVFVIELGGWRLHRYYEREQFVRSDAFRKRLSGGVMPAAGAPVEAPSATPGPYVAWFAPQPLNEEDNVPRAVSHWDCSAFLVREGLLPQIEADLGRGEWTDTHGVLHSDPAAPERVRHWRGPSLTVVTRSETPRPAGGTAVNAAAALGERVERARRALEGKREGEDYDVLARTDWADEPVPTIVLWRTGPKAGMQDDFTQG